MTDIAALHRAALDRLRPLMAGIGDDQWGAATPCDDWDLRTLVNHIIAGNLWAAELATGGTIDAVGDRLDGDVIGDDVVAAYDASAQQAEAAFEAPGALDAPCAVSYGPVPGSVYAGHRFVDVLIHGWDVAVASGQDPSIPDDLVAGCFEVLAPQQDLLKASGMFGGEVAVDDSADAQTRLLALLGRRG